VNTGFAARNVFLKTLEIETLELSPLKLINRNFTTDIPYLRLMMAQTIRDYQ